MEDFALGARLFCFARMEVAASAAPRVECGVLSMSRPRSRSGSRVPSSSASVDRVTARQHCNSSAPDLLRRDGVCSFGKNRLCCGALLPIVVETFPKLRARRNCLVIVRADKDENGTEKTYEVANLGQPLTTDETDGIANLDQPLITEEIPGIDNLGQPLTTEETPDIANLGQPIIVRKSALSTSLDFWVQVGIFVFAAGFVDAGFSGDWSRIGVLSKQTEEELQMAAIGVVPLAITLIWSISKRRKES